MKANEEPMSKKKELKNIPRLRFPDFTSAGMWMYENGDILFDQISDKNHNSDLPILAITQEQGAIPRREIDYHVTVTDKSVESYKVVQKGDFIISLRSFQGGIEYSNYQGICSPAYVILRKNGDLIDGFYKYYFKTSRFIGDLTKNLEGLRDGKMVSYKQFSELMLPNPIPAEQRKIADCLSSLDELLAAENKKLEALKAHKKGLMQMLFPAEGQTQPHYRFSEFKDSGDWKEKKLGEVARFINGRAYRQEELLEKGKYKVLRVGNFFSNNEWYYSDLELDHDKYCQDGDLLYAWSASFGPRIWNGDKTIYHYHIWKVIAEANMSRKFLFFLLDRETEKMKAQSANGFALLHITKATIEGWKCWIPNLLNEQKKIGNFIETINVAISSEIEKISQLKRHKQGLMQQLFPTTR